MSAVHSGCCDHFPVTLRVEPDAEPAIQPPARRASRSIIAPAARPFALVLFVAAGAALAVLAIAYHGDRYGTSLDDRLAQHLNSSLGSTLSAATLHASDQRMTVALLVLVVVGRAAVSPVGRRGVRHRVADRWPSS